MAGTQAFPLAAYSWCLRSHRVNAWGTAQRSAVATFAREFTLATPGWPSHPAQYGPKNGIAW